jgi:ABC-type antimicrobial peptide transport system permease subunit
MGNTQSPFRTVVGVAGDVHGRAIDASAGRQWYVPERQWYFSDAEETLIIRTRGSPAALASTIRDVVQRVDPTQAVTRIATLDQVVAASTGQRRLALVLFGAFAIVALLLSVTGIYGVLAATVAERTREIGLRSALGATPAQILSLVMRHGFQLVALGTVLGLVGAVGLTRLLRTLLFGVSTSDPVTIGGVVVLLGVVAGLACLIPARRAVRVDPSTALRTD